MRRIIFSSSWSKVQQAKAYNKYWDIGYEKSELVKFQDARKYSSIKKSNSVLQKAVSF